jgi:preprotein translocase subunit SecA
MGDDHIEHKMLSRGIENAQKRIESKNFDARKNLLEYDDVSNDQRQAIYSLRNQLLEEDNITQTIQNLIEDQFGIISNTYIPIDSIESQWRSSELEKHLIETYDLQTNIANEISLDKKLIPETIALKVIEFAKNKYKSKYGDVGDNLIPLEKQVMLQVLDVHWKEHLAEIDHLRNSVGLRSYAQKNPKNEFKKEAYSMFETMLEDIDNGTIKILFSLQIASEDDVSSITPEQKNENLVMEKEDPSSNIIENNQPPEEIQQSPQTVTRDEPKLGRNELVKITNGHETKEMKYKKAKPLLDSNEWTII